MLYVVGDKPATQDVRAESFVHSGHFLSVTLSKVGTDILKNRSQYFTGLFASVHNYSDR